MNIFKTLIQRNVHVPPKIIVSRLLSKYIRTSVFYTHINILKCIRVDYKNRTIINLEASDFLKTYTCNITNEHGLDSFKTTTIKPASRNTQTFNPLPALLPTIIILLTIATLTTTSTFLGIYYKRKITMFFYYRLAKEPPYVKGLQHDVFISFASLDKDFVEEKVSKFIRQIYPNRLS